MPVSSQRVTLSQPAELQPQKPQRRPRSRATLCGAVTDSPRALAAKGWLIIFMFFGVLGSWSVIAPLNGAVIANGVVKLEGNRKRLQHHDGGIVRKINVHEGDRVAAGDLLIQLDDTQSRIETDILDRQYLDLRAAGARLEAELTQSPKIVFPHDLAAARKQARVDPILAAQVQQFDLRNAALEGQKRIIGEKIAQFDAQIKGTEAQAESARQQRESIRREVNSIAPLVERGVVAKPRFLQLERSAAVLDGEIGASSASIARSRQAIIEQRQLALQLDQERAAEASKNLRENQAQLAEIASRLTGAEHRLEHMQIRAPYSGVVVGLAVFSTGAVIAPGEKILDIVPDRQTLIVEAQIGVDDIADVRPGLRAEIRLLAYKQRTTPTISGEVIQVSADRLFDNRGGNPFYLAQIRIADVDAVDMPGVKLYPGMSTTVMIPTLERSAFDYLVGPLLASFDRAFRQK